MGLSKSRLKLKPEIAAGELRLIDRYGDEHVLKVKAGKTLLELAVDKSVDLPHSCGGMGSCGTCRVRLTVESGETPERSEVEVEMATERGFAEDERLSCQLEIPDKPFSWRAESLGSPDEDWFDKER
jgi:ferredoxin, 2Fe-2S